MRRLFPWLTLAVFVLTALTTGAMVVWPQIGPALERDPAILTHGEVWRLVTTWLVQTDGWAQIGINFAGLAIFGVLAEWITTRFWWAVAYVVAGLTGEIAGLFWQPVGGGCSVAICGLIGLFSVWQLRRQQSLGLQRYLGAVIWFGGGLWLCLRADIHGPALVAGFVVGALAFARQPAERAPHV